MTTTCQQAHPELFFQVPNPSCPENWVIMILHIIIIYHLAATQHSLRGRGKKIDFFLGKVLNYGWVGVKSPKLFSENICHVYMEY